MSTPDQDARRKSEKGRQVISGSDIRSSNAWTSRSVSYEDEAAFSSPQWIYLGVMVALAFLALILYLVFGGGVASVFVFLLALLLFAAWFVF
jgi:hypothetical protein